jgi:coiled-coil-helix-coiled-coil-helix domain-containing protein 10
MLSGIGSTIAQGMAFGTGSAIAHRAVGAVANSFGGDEGEAAPAEQQQQQYAAAPQQQQLTGACANDKEMFFDCLKVNQGDQQACSFLYDQLQSCQRNETTFG